MNRSFNVLKDYLFTKMFFVFVIIASICITGCDSGSDPDPNPEPEPEKPVDKFDYVVVVRKLKANDKFDEQLVFIDSLTGGEIKLKSDSAMQPGWCVYAGLKNTYLSFSYDDGMCTAFQRSQGKFVEKGDFEFDRIDCSTTVGENTLVIAGGPWLEETESVIRTIDIDNVSVRKTISTPLYEGLESSELTAWPSGMIVRDDKLFVSFYPTVGSTLETPSTDTAYVSVFSYPDLVYQSTIKDVRTGPIGYYGGSPGMIQTEDGDIYTLSPTAFAAGFSQVTRPSGILRIKKGQTTFDKDYFFQIDPLKGAKVLTAVYVGNNKIVARIVPEESSKLLWRAFDVYAPICKLVVIDLVAKTIEAVEMTANGSTLSPFLHGGQYATPFLVEEGKVYMSINDGAETYIYKIDPATATATRGAKVNGQEVQAIYSVQKD